MYILGTHIYRREQPFCRLRYLAHGLVMDSCGCNTCKAPSIGERVEKVVNNSTKLTIDRLPAYSFLKKKFKTRTP